MNAIQFNHRIRKYKKVKELTEEEIKIAMEKYGEAGGVITHLPDEKVLPRLIILSTYEPYESTRS